MSTEEIRRLYADLVAKRVEPSDETVEPFRREAGKLDIGEHVRIRGHFFTARGSREPWPVGYTGTIVRSDGRYAHVRFHRIPVTLEFSMLDLERVARASLSGLPAEWPLSITRGQPGRPHHAHCAHCASRELLHVQDVEEFREPLGYDEHGDLLVLDAPGISSAAPHRPRIVCLSCDREYDAEYGIRFVSTRP